MTDVSQQPITDDQIQVRQITHYQFSWTAGGPNEPGTHVVQLVLDQGASEEVLTLQAFDSIALQFKLATSVSAFYDVRRRTVTTNVVPVGAGLAAALS